MAVIKFYNIHDGIFIAHYIQCLSFHFRVKKVTSTLPKPILCFTVIRCGAWYNHFFKSREGPLSVTRLTLSSTTQLNYFFKSGEREPTEMFFLCKEEMEEVLFGEKLILLSPLI